MIDVLKIRSEIFTSNTYLITSSQKEEVFLIDCGAFDEVIEHLPSNAILKGIFLTHYHYDHIYYIEKWIEMYPDVKVYGSLITKEGVENPKRNLSFYHEDPIKFEIINFKTIEEGSIVSLFKSKYELYAFETDGHCEGSLTFLLGNYIFTGDALIPNIPVVTKLKTGDKLKAKISIDKIRSLAEDKCLICPGHLEILNYNDVNWNLYANN